MNKILTIIFLSIILMMSGCTTYNKVDKWVNTKLIDNNSPVNWHSQAGIYASNYPYCTKNEKALMLANDMKEANVSFRLIRKYYKAEVIYIEMDRARVWPPLYRDDEIIKEYEKLEIIDEKIEYNVSKD